MDNNTILNAILELKDDINKVDVKVERLSGEVHKNNGIKKLVETNATTISQCTTKLDEHLLMCMEREKQSNVRSGKWRWAIPVLISTIAVIFTGLGFILK